MQKRAIGYLASNAIVGVAGKLFGRGLAFVLQVLLGRLLAPGLYGVYALVWILARLASEMLLLGLDNAVSYFSKAEAIDYTLLRRSVLLIIGLFGIGGAGLVVIGPERLLQLFQNNIPLSTLYRAGGLVLLMALLRVVNAALRAGWLASVAVFTEDVVQPMVGLAIVIFLYRAGMLTVEAVFSGLTIAYGSAVVVSVVALSRQRRHQPDAPPTVPFRQVVAYASATMLVNVISGLLLLWTDRLVVGAMLPIAAVGGYHAAGQVAVILTVIPYAINLIYVPLCAQLFKQGRYADFHDLYMINTRWSVYGVAPLVLVMIGYAPDVILVLFGPDYVAAGGVLRVLVVGQLVSLLAGPVVYTLMMIGQQGFLLWANLGILLTNIVLNVWWVHLYGVIGAALASMVVMVGSALLMLMWLWRQTQVSPFSRYYLRVLALMVGCVVLVLGLRAVIPSLSVVGLGVLSLSLYGLVGVTISVLPWLHPDADILHQLLNELRLPQ